MATILRSSKYVRGFAELATKLGFSQFKRDVRVSLLQKPRCVHSTFTKSLSTQVAAKPVDKVSDLENKLQELDDEVKRFGRIRSRKLKTILRAFNNSKFITGTQALMILRCCGNLLVDELPESKSALVNQIWKNLENSGIQLDLSHYNALLRVYVENEYPFSPTEILAEMERKGIEPNKMTYQRLIARYCQQGDIEGASKILEFMREKQISVNEDIFTALVKGHSQAGDMVSAADILTVMRQSGLEPSPDTYKELLCGYARQGNIESIRKTLSTCQEKNINLLHTDLLDVISSLTINGHSEYVREILSIIPQDVGYLQDSLTYILKLTHAGHIDVGMEILSSIPVRDKGSSGVSVIKQLANSNMPVEKLIDFCKQFEAKGINTRALLIALETTLLKKNVEASLALLKVLNQSNIEIRQHYFWPILITLGQSNDNTGVIEVLKAMRTEYHLEIKNETLREYVLPYKTGKPDDILSEISAVDVPPGIIACGITYQLITQKKLKEAVDFATKYSFRYKESVFKGPLMIALKETKDVTSFTKILETICLSLNDSKSNDNQQAITNNGIEPYILNMVSYLKDNDFNLLTEVFKKLKDVGFGISDTTDAKIRQIMGDKITPHITGLLNTMKSRSYIFPSAMKMSFHLAITKLENELSKVDDEESAIVLKQRLLYFYCQIKDLPNIKRLEMDLNEKGRLNERLYKQLIYIHGDSDSDSDSFDTVRKYFQSLKELNPNFTIGDTPIINYITFLAKNNRIDDATKFLEEQCNFKAKDYKNNKRTFWKLLNSLAELGNPQVVNAVFQTLLEKAYIDTSGPNLGPLINVHIIRGDLKEALNAFERVCKTYQHTPLKNELSKKLIEAEDANALQRLTDLSTEIHGEVNSLYDLAMSFIECNCLRQAKKILEIPALQSRNQRLVLYSQRFCQQQNIIYLERLVSVIKDIPCFKIVPTFYNDLLNCYVRTNEWEKGLSLWNQMKEEETEPSDEFLMKLANLLKKNKQPIPFTVPEASNAVKPQVLPDQQTSLKTTVKDNSTSRDANTRTKLQNEILEYSKEIESLVQQKQLNVAFEAAEKMLENDMFPIINIFRYLLLHLALNGEVEMLLSLEKKVLALRKRLALNFEKRICQAHIISNRANEYLDILENRFEANDQGSFKNLRPQFPFKDLIIMLKKNPQLVGRYAKFAEKYAARGIMYPLNVLWIHYFIEGNPEADKLWSEYLVKYPTIKFFEILVTAKNTENPQLIRKLIDTLKSSDDKLITTMYSKLMEIYDIKGDDQQCLDVLTEALNIVPKKNLDQQIIMNPMSELESEKLKSQDGTDKQINSHQGTPAREQLVT